jgi:hypothetical protein
LRHVLDNGAQQWRCQELYYACWCVLKAGHGICITALKGR